MSAIFLLIGFSLVVAVGFLIAFFWAVGNGQYEDAYTPSVRMLWDDKASTAPRTEPDPENLPSEPEPDSDPPPSGS